jgi:hypothetical protein
MVTNPELDSKLIVDQPQVPTIKIEVTVNEINLIMMALQELPHRVADPILHGLMQQAQLQIQKETTI